jgi:hypothetical protein
MGSIIKARCSAKYPAASLFYIIHIYIIVAIRQIRHNFTVPSLILDVAILIAPLGYWDVSIMIIIHANTTFARSFVHCEPSIDMFVHVAGLSAAD